MSFGMGGRPLLIGKCVSVIFGDEWTLVGVPQWYPGLGLELGFPEPIPGKCKFANQHQSL